MRQKTDGALSIPPGPLLAKKLVGDKHMREQHVWVKRLWVMGDNCVGEKHVAKNWVRKVCG